jgi:hypothetical protein
MDELITYEEIETRSWSAVSTAPNGSSRGVDHWTVVVLRQRWADVPENGIYAGLHYEIRDLYCSSRPGSRGTRVSSSSRPWTRVLTSE